jgi:hypothetical protein
MSLENFVILENEENSNEKYMFQIRTEPVNYSSNWLLKNIGNLDSYKRVNEHDTLLGTECAICYDTYKLNEYKRRLPNCCHTFHKKCIDRWLIQKYKNKHIMDCPLCRDILNH